jgi:hypothetical protein
MKKFFNNFVSQFLTVSIIIMICEIFILLFCHFVMGREVTQKMLASFNGTDLLIFGIGVPFMFTLPVMLMDSAVKKLNSKV